MSIFVHRFNLLFLFWFINCCIHCALKLCYCCCPLAVCLDQLWLILLGADWTPLMSAYNLLIPFIVCCFWCVCALCVCTCLCVHEGVFVRDRWGWVVVSMCWKWVDLIYTGLFTQQRREGASCIACLSVSFLFRSLSVFSHMLVAFWRYCSTSRLSHTLPFLSFFVSHLLHFNSLSSSANLWLSTYSLSISVVGFYYSVYFYFNNILSDSSLISYSLTLSPCT